MAYDRARDHNKDVKFLLTYFNLGHLLDYYKEFGITRVTQKEWNSDGEMVQPSMEIWFVALNRTYYATKP